MKKKRGKIIKHLEKREKIKMPEKSGKRKTDFFKKLFCSLS